MPKSGLYLLGLLLVITLTLAPQALGHGGNGPKTFTLVSGNGTAPGRDPFNRFSVDQGATWEKAYIVPKCGAPGPWDTASCLFWANPIPGTEWIGVNADKSGPPESWYGRRFKVPSRCRTASVTIDVHADNDVAVFLNGVVFGEQPAGALFPNFQDPPERFTTDARFKRRWNKLGFRVRDYGNPTALDYEATVTCKRKHWGGH